MRLYSIAISFTAWNAGQMYSTTAAAAITANSDSEARVLAQRFADDHEFAKKFRGAGVSIDVFEVPKQMINRLVTLG